MTNFERGEAYFKLRNYNKAIEYFNLAISDILDGDLLSLSNIYIYIAYCYSQLNNTKSTINMLVKSIEFVDDVDVYADLGELYFDEGNYKKAYVYLKGAVANGIEDEEINNKIKILEKELFSS